MADLDSFLDRIDEATTEQCHWCSGPLGDSVSEWWCSYQHQQAWTEHQADVARLTHYMEPWDTGFAPAEPLWGNGEGLHPSREVSDENYGRPQAHTAHIHAWVLDPRDRAEPVQIGSALHALMANLSAAADEWVRAMSRAVEAMFLGGQRGGTYGRVRVTFVEVDRAAAGYTPGGFMLGPADRAVDEAAVLVEAARQAAAQTVVEPAVRIADRRALTGPAPGWGPTVHADPRRNRRVR